MVSLRWCESLAKAPLHAITRGAGLARVGFPVPAVEGASEGPCELPICCADTDAIVAIIKHPKTATPASMTDPASILPPCALAVVEQPEKLRYAERSSRSAAPQWSASVDLPIQLPINYEMVINLKT